MVRILYLFGIVGIIFSVLSCGSVVNQKFKPQEARLAAHTPEYTELQNLPRPAKEVPIAVYNFRDQTGQYKASETGSNWSTAVTQGATTILINTLEKSGWFLPIERENISNLLNERKIIRSTRQQYGNEEQLPPLLFAGIILEGGIISYETNVRTGGAGLRYFGADASGQYREDRISIYIRAVSTKNGKVLKTVNTTKTVLSQKVDVGLFRYVTFKRILEFESGITFNEPSDLAVRGAIEKGVQALIIEGIFDGIWSLADRSDTAHPSIISYQKEKGNNQSIDYLGRSLFKDQRNNFGITVESGINIYAGDYPQAKINPMIQGYLSYNFSKNFGIRAGLGHSSLRAADVYRGNFTYSDLQLTATFLPYEKVSPYLFAGGGFLFEHNNNMPEVPIYRYLGMANGGLGFQFMTNDKLGINVSGSVNYLFTDNLDGIEQGRFNDFYWNADVGITYYFNMRDLFGGNNGNGENENTKP